MPVMATLTITLDQAGAVSVTGPIENRLLCYGLLALARDIIATHSTQLQSRLVQPVTALPSLLKVD